MSKILILSNDFFTVNSVRIELLNELINKKHEVVISVPYDERNTIFQQLKCKVDEIKMERWSKNPFKEILLLLAYIKQIKRLKPDVTLAYTIKPNIFGSIACSIFNIPVINNITGLGSIFYKKGFLMLLILALQKFSLRYSFCVFFQNEQNLLFFKEKKIVKNRSRLLPGSGVNLIINMLENYPAFTGKLRFLTISRLRSDKGYDELLNAIKDITTLNKDIEFHIVGWHEEIIYKKKIEDMASRYPIFYHGSQPKEMIHNFIKNSHCLIHPSHHEGMSNVILEAAACGRPCIVSDISGCREAVENEVTGYIFEVKNATCLIENIRKFIQIPYEEKKIMGLAGRKKMEKEFDRKIVVNAYIEEIEKAIKQKRKAL